MKKISYLRIIRPFYFLIFFIILIIFLLFNRNFTTSGNVVPLAIWQDIGAQYTFEQMVAVEQDNSMPSLFTRKADRGFSGGYTTDAFWMKFTLPASHQQQQVYLEVQPTYLDYVTLYWPDGDGNFNEVTLGDRVAFNQRLVHSRGFVFPVNLGPIEKTGYLRLQTSSSSLMLLKFWQVDAFHRKNQQEYFLFALLIGVGISLIFFNGLQIAGQKSVMYYAFILFLLVQVASIVFINGFASEFLFPNSPTIDSAFVGIVTMLLLVSISLGHYFFLRLTWQETPVLFSLTQGGVALALVGMMGVVLGYYVNMMPFLGVYVIVLYLSWIVFGLKRVRQKDAYAHWVVFASVAGIFSSVAMILVLLGWLSVEHVGLYAYQVGSIAAIFAFQMIISGHIKDSLHKNRQLVIEKVTQRKLLQQEQAAQQKQSQFIAMLTHEIKTPLSVIQIALAQLAHRAQPHALTAAQDIVDILDRCLISERLEASAMEPQLSDINLHLWLQDFLGYMDFEKSRLHYDFEKNAIGQVRADALYLRIVFSNLIDNALKYSPTDSIVRLTLMKVTNEKSGQQLVFKMTNLVGKVGLPDAARLFDKYYRAQGAHRISGSGIGLYLVKELVKAIQAEIVYSVNSTIKCNAVVA